MDSLAAIDMNKTFRMTWPKSRPASQSAFVLPKLPSSFGADNGPVPSAYSVYCILDSLRSVRQSIIPRLPYTMDVSLKC